MTVSLTFLCAGATSATRAVAFAADEPLLEGQAEAAARLGNGLKRPASLPVSSSQSARQTAEALGWGTAVPIAPDPGLGDWNVGRWRGRALAEIAARDEDGFRAWLSDPAAAPHGGETLCRLIERVGDWLDAHRAYRGRIIAVSHPAVLRAATVHVLQASAQAFWRIDAAPLSRLELSGDGTRWNLRLSAGQA